MSQNVFTEGLLQYYIAEENKTLIFDRMFPKKGENKTRATELAIGGPKICSQKVL